MEKKSTKIDWILFGVLVVLAILFLAPIFLVLTNSFKSQLFIFGTGGKFFKLPNKESFVGFDNYINGAKKIGIFSAAGYSLWITIASVLLIVVCTAMTGWYITRVKNKFTSFLYYFFVFSMIVPFQMVMFTMSKLANELHLDNKFGIIIIYLGFGAGLSVFMYCGFVKAIPYEIEEAAMIDGCNPFRIFFNIIVPMLKPTMITVAILNAMWIWNDFLLPFLVIGTKFRTIPVAIQYLKGGYGSVAWGDMMAMLLVALIPIIVFYLACQKYIIKGVAAGAVKG